MNHKSILFDPIQILFGSNENVKRDAVLISGQGELIAFGEDARKQGHSLGLNAILASEKLLAPCLVDPHSVLSEPTNDKGENLKSLRIALARAGYGQVALLPRCSSSWRDRPERLEGFLNSTSDVLIHLWGSFSKEGKSIELSPHASLLQHGAIGITEDDFYIPSSFLERGLLIGGMGSAPILLAPRDPNIQGNGMVREGVEALRAGWAPDPVTSETLPLGSILQLQKHHPERSIVIMNIGTADGVELIANSKQSCPASVCWWHLVADSSLLNPEELGWKVNPSLGNPKDREALIHGLKEDTLTAISVHAIPLDEEDSQTPPNIQLPGIAGHQLVLPSLWNELVVKSKWPIEKLWEKLSFGPSKMLQLPEEHLELGTKRWLLFDPDEYWVQRRREIQNPNAANQPWEGKTLKGKVIASGLKAY
ncbi:dihydroorotase [Prochlorococcus sp. MIT 1300]|uniref:dihydroorotase n=1 Tax=Prochlorococcus sp. MIT 1300 TaxID=3096218 RepID=UPI002A74C30D|nr:dihydroorotase [Prochlorococcus sp. MIT 1300]